MKKKYLIVIFILSLVFAAGCSHYRALDKDFGKSYNMAKQGQILNPDASKNLKPVTGLSGKAAAANEEKYLNSFGKAPDGQSKGYVVPMIPAGMGQDANDK